MGRRLRWRYLGLVNPATEDVIESVPFGTADDARAAIDAASAAFGAWAAKTPFERAAVLMRAAELITERADDYARITTEESGKPFAQSKAEWLSAPNYLVYAAEEAKRLYGRIIPSRVPGGASTSPISPSAWSVSSPPGTSPSTT
jgi:succinate-semialdehyde dehydrogenase / glutarate-semialdehyde dehydrogenase